MVQERPRDECAAKGQNKYDTTKRRTSGGDGGTVGPGEQAMDT